MMTMRGNRGPLITFEGGDGSGKSTQMRLLARRLKRLGLSPVVIREPGGTDLGEWIRRALLDPDWQSMSARTEALLYAASRTQLIHEKIRPSLKKGRLVLCDRYLDSSLAYQGYGLGLDLHWLKTVNWEAAYDVIPDRTFLFDLPVQQWGRGRDTPPDRIEDRDRAFRRRVRNGFLQLAQQHSERFMVLDATQSQAMIQQAVWQRFKSDWEVTGE